MGKERVNILGKRFGNLTVIEYSHKIGYTRYFLCRCDCGNTCLVAKNNLTTGKQISCGCKRKTRLADMNRLPDGYLRLGAIYRKMVKRCYDPKSNRFKNYGGKGIKICDEWLNDINAFRKWAVCHGYKEGLTIERIDINGDYCPNNCTWIPKKEQMYNKSNTVRITFNGKTQTLSQWSQELGIPTSTLHNRIRVHGWTVERALTEPIHKQNRKSA